MTFRAPNPIISMWGNNPICDPGYLHGGQMYAIGMSPRWLGKQDSRCPLIHFIGVNQFLSDQIRRIVSCLKHRVLAHVARAD